MSKQVDFKKKSRDKEAVWLSRRKGKSNADILRSMMMTRNILIDNEKDTLDNR